MGREGRVSAGAVKALGVPMRRVGDPQVDRRGGRQGRGTRSPVRGPLRW